jgi:hypothetical protein
MCFAQTGIRFFGWRRAAGAAKPVERDQQNWYPVLRPIALQMRSL